MVSIPLDMRPSSILTDLADFLRLLYLVCVLETDFNNDH